MLEEFYEPWLYEVGAGDSEPHEPMSEFYFSQLCDTGLNILDLGCGLGRTAIYLANHGHNVTCVDRSAAMLAAAEANVRKHRSTMSGAIEFVKTEFPAETHLDTTFDAAIAVDDFLLHYRSAQELDSFFAALSAHLNKGGVFLTDVRRRTMRELRILASRPSMLTAFPITKNLPGNTNGFLAVSQWEEFAPLTRTLITNCRYEKGDTLGCVNASFYRQLVQRVHSNQEIIGAGARNGFMLLSHTARFSVTPVDRLDIGGSFKFERT